ncbi:hypothetical protein [Halomarina ordinaria]|uniref:DUF7847 domain-containing protein n=1 Tax=Halomarina ordinaria TaxID=3033939 RepID=A0ABD5UC42_9EURY|nr:hypothetical protein [Halomarina sp. PSRA2]
MALQLGRMFVDGTRRVLTRTGGILLLALLVIQLLTQAAVNTAVLGLFPPEASGELEGMLGLTLPVSGTVGGILFVVAILLSSVYFVVATRALARPLGDLSTFPSVLYTRRMGRATLSMVVGGLVVGVSVTIGLALIIVPGVFLTICFLFFIFTVGVEDRGIIDGLQASWALSRGNRLKLSVFVVLAFLVGGVTGILGTLFDLAGVPIVGEVVTITLTSALALFGYGLMAAAYLQLRDDDADEFDGSGTATPADGTAGVEY